MKVFDFFSGSKGKIFDFFSDLRHRFIFTLAVGISLWHLYINFYSFVPDHWSSAIHFGSLGLLSLLMTPSTFRFFGKEFKTVSLFLNILLAVATLAVVAYLILFTDALYARGQDFDTWDWVFSFIAVLLAAEFSRRTTGWFIPTLALIGFTYIFWWGKYVEGIFHFSGLSVETSLFRIYFSEDGMFGPIAQISWTFVFMFILLGAFLNKSGASKFILDLSVAIAGRFVGGGGFVAVIASGFMGSVSGSAIANAASTGIVTIPMMKKSGFKPEFAAGAEAAASTGGQIMPPVMGAGAFVMASTTQISYIDIVSAAMLPALLFFISIIFFVRVNAKKYDIKSVDPASVPNLRKVLREGWFFLIPFVVLISLLIYGYTPTYSAAYAIASVVISSYFSNHKMNIKAILEALRDGAKGAVSVSLLLIVIGILVVAINTTAVGSVFSLMIMEWSGNSLFFALVLIALASLILGMGLPVTASYIVLGTLCAPLIYGMLAEQAVIQVMMDGSLNASAAGILQLFSPAIDFTQNLTYDQAALAFEPFSKLENSSMRSMLFEQALDPSTRATMLLISHMIIFWLSQDSNVTPPVCLVAYTAASIANASTLKTGFYAWKISKGLYIISFLMAYTALISSDFSESLYVFVILFFGLYGSVVLFEKYSEGPVSWFEYVMFIVATIGLLWPHNVWQIHLVSIVLILMGILLSSRKLKLQVSQA